MALNRKYANLPDLDSAPDIYETPDLTDDNSTVPTTTVRSSSDDGYLDEDNERAEISRSRLRIDEARSRFLPSQVDAQDVDFSDRLDSKRKSYKTSSRRRRMLEDGTEQLGDLSDEEDGEDLERKIARLKREITEAKEEYGKKKANSLDRVPDQDGELLSLSRALDELSSTSKEASYNRLITPKDPTEPNFGGPDVLVPGTDATYTVTYTPTYEQSHALAKAADFDRRLVLLEKSIGFNAAALPNAESNGLPRAVLPTLDTLQRQILTLSDASTASLDSISRRVRALTQEAEQLEKTRRAAKAAQDALESSGVSGAGTVPPDESEQLAKINALYGTLPTIENLSPVLPALLDRLRSLRAIHADAATASETLDRIEKTQTEMATDIKQWKQGLEKVEEAMKQGTTAVKGNMATVEGWVKELEKKLERLG